MYMAKKGKEAGIEQALSTISTIIDQKVDQRVSAAVTRETDRAFQEAKHRMLATIVATAKLWRYSSVTEALRNITDPEEAYFLTEQKFLFSGSMQPTPIAEYVSANPNKLVDVTLELQQQYHARFNLEELQIMGLFNPEILTSLEAELQEAQREVATITQTLKPLLVGYQKPRPNGPRLAKPEQLLRAWSDLLRIKYPPRKDDRVRTTCRVVLFTVAQVLSLPVRAGSFPPSPDTQELYHMAMQNSTDSYSKFFPMVVLQAVKDITSSVL